MIKNLTESFLVDIWQRQRLDGALLTEEGEPFRVIYPGRANDEAGADLRDAVISTTRGLIKGDIEVHTRSSYWQAHHHHRDPAYNSVILHVVYRHDSRVAASLQSGKSVPTLVISRFINERPLQISEGEPCRAAHRAGGDGLDRAGEARFRAKAAGFQKELGQTGAAQVLYAGIMGALGYTRNKWACLELARRVPLEALNFDGTYEEECLARQQAWLLGTAGLLPSQRSGPGRIDQHSWPARLERLWVEADYTKVMPETDWHLLKVRPNNSPQRRIAAMSYLLLRYRKSGILSAILGRIRDVTADSGCGLRETVKLSATGYWADHSDFGLTMPETALIGDGRAAEIVVNVLLPFAAAWGRLNDEPGLIAKAVALYRGYPRLAVNSIEDRMRRQLGLERGLVNSAQRQQGLLYIYRVFCSQAMCPSCPI